MVECAKSIAHGLVRTTNPQKHVISRCISKMRGVKPGTKLYAPTALYLSWYLVSHSAKSKLKKSSWATLAPLYNTDGQRPRNEFFGV